MDRELEGIHTGFLRRIMWKRARQLRGGTWETPGVEGVRESAGTQLARTYISKQQETVSQWVELSPLFEVCTRETGYEGGGGGRRES